VPLAFSAPNIVENDRVLMWQHFNAPKASIYDNIYLVPLGLYMRTDITGRDPSKWKVTGWVYNNVFYDSLDGLREAIKDPNFERLGTALDEEWSRTEPQGDALPLDEQPPPVSVRPGQPRYTVDETENYVTWSKYRWPISWVCKLIVGLVDFTFYISITRDNGLRFYDVHYKGQRILYEVNPCRTIEFNAVY
jgi:primary-amine oxidase